MAQGRSDIKVDFFAHPNFKQPSVIAEIRGNGPEKDEVVVIGGHLDSIARDVSPGADDNASGTATVMETFRHLVETGFAPNRTILFMGYAGEEEGLLGSGEIAAWFRNKGRKVVGVLQFDMTMYPGSAPRITFITDHTNPDLTKFTERLSDEYVKAKWIEDRCGYACSDHASWTRAGFASAFPFETAFHDYNPDIHTARDTTANLSASHGLNYLKLGLAFAVELSEVKSAAFRLR
jgi:leucyl aminopeptidase